MGASPLCNPAHAGETTSSSSETSLNPSQQIVTARQPGRARADSPDVSRFTKCYLFGNLSPRTKRGGGVGDRTETDPTGPTEQKLQLRQQASGTSGVGRNCIIGWAGTKPDPSRFN